MPLIVEDNKFKIITDLVNFKNQIIIKIEVIY
jgi:hypothetical protein